MATWDEVVDRIVERLWQAKQERAKEKLEKRTQRRQRPPARHTRESLDRWQEDRLSTWTDAQGNEYRWVPVGGSRYGAPRCRAKNRKGQRCRAKCWVKDDGTYSTVCRHHGGLSTGPKTPEGRAQSSANLARARAIWAEVRRKAREQAADAPGTASLSDFSPQQSTISDDPAPTYRVPPSDASKAGSCVQGVG